MNKDITKPDHPTRRSEAFFGRRKSKSLSPTQENRNAELLPKLRFDPTSKPLENLSSAFPLDAEKIILEIGFGGGEHLIHQASTFTTHAFIGVEPFVNSMAKGLQAIDERNIKNTRLYDEDAVELLDWLPENSLDRIDLLYPDPWPKKKHWKRRFINQKNLSRFARVLKPGSIFRFASDIETYINWTLQHCEEHAAFEWQAETAHDWHTPYPNWIRTRYEAKAIREGRRPCYLRFKRV